MPLLLPQEYVQRTFRRFRHIPENMGINHGCFYILMAEQFLNLADVYTVHQQMCGKTVA